MDHYTIGAKIQAFECIYCFTDYMDYRSLFLVSRLFHFVFVRMIQRDVSVGKERNSIKVKRANNKSHPCIPTMNFEYVTENVYWRFARQFLASCHCQNDSLCNDGNECCHYGDMFKIMENDILILKKSPMEILRIIECNQHCSCDPLLCHNKITQNDGTLGKRVSVYLKYDECTKWGLFTRCRIFKGQFVVEFVGEILNKQELNNRNNKTFILTVNQIVKEEDNGKDKIVDTLSIDPLRCGNIARFINHSCDPNLFPILVYAMTDIPKICLFAIKDIDPCSELTFNYGSIGSNTSNIASTQRCYCRSGNCQQYLPHSTV